MLPDIVERLSEQLNLAVSRVTVRVGEFLQHSGVLPRQTLCDTQLVFCAFTGRGKSLIKGCRNCRENVNVAYVLDVMQCVYTVYVHHILNFFFFLQCLQISLLFALFETNALSAVWCLSSSLKKVD